MWLSRALYFVYFSFHLGLPLGFLFEESNLCLYHLVQCYRILYCVLNVHVQNLVWLLNELKTSEILNFLLNL